MGEPGRCEARDNSYCWGYHSAYNVRNSDSPVNSIPEDIGAVVVKLQAIQVKPANPLSHIYQEELLSKTILLLTWRHGYAHGSVSRSPAGQTISHVGSTAILNGISVYPH